jgi:hypothetical protein
MSIRSALETLGLGKSYHMQEVFLNPSHAAIWDRATDGELPDWKTLLEGYAATLDGPACFYWREITCSFSDASVLLVKRDPRAWYRSMKATIFPTLLSDARAAEPGIAMIRRLLLDKVLDGRFDDEAFATRCYVDYCNEVEAETPSDKLLIYEVSEGWGPLCNFLGCEEPNEPFPNKNSTGEFRRRARLDDGT